MAKIQSLSPQKNAVSPDKRIIKIKTENKSLGVIKTLVTFALIGLQLILIVFLYVLFIDIFRWYLIISFILSLISCFFILSSDKNSASKAVWIFFVLLFFVIGYMLYFLSNEKVFFRKHRKRYKQIFNRTKNLKITQNSDIDADIRVKEDCKYLLNTGNFNAFYNTDLKYYPSGGELFDSVIEDMQKAEKFIFLEFFIVADGVLLERILSILFDKVKSGVDVRIIFDDMGSHGTLKERTKLRIRKSGIKLVAFNRVMPVISFGINFRDHRKIVIIDGIISYTGGANLADEYINEKRIFGYWKDAGIRLKGLATNAFTVMFLRQWEFITKKQEDYSAYLSQAELFQK